VGWTVISLALVQIVYVFLFRISRDKLGADTTFILGKILCLCMIPVIPTGTYFGFYGWKDLDIIFGKESNYEKIQIIKGDVSLQQADTSLGNTVLSSALVMLHMPIALLLVQLMLITLPIDMAYPLLAYNQTEPWAQVSWAILAVFLFQILCGLFYNKITQWNRNAAKYLVLFFVLFQLLSFSLFMQVLLTTMGPALELEGAMKIIIYLAWVFGILLNPLGVHFALMLKNELNAVQKIRE